MSSRGEAWCIICKDPKSPSPGGGRCGRRGGSKDWGTPTEAGDKGSRGARGDRRCCWVVEGGGERGERSLPRDALRSLPDDAESAAGSMGRRARLARGAPPPPINKTESAGAREAPPPGARLAGHARADGATPPVGSAGPRSARVARPPRGASSRDKRNRYLSPLRPRCAVRCGFFFFWFVRFGGWTVPVGVGWRGMFLFFFVVVCFFLLVFEKK